MFSVKFSVLGPLEADWDGAPLDLGPPKQRLILATLLLARGRVVPVQDMLSAVWGDEPPASAVGSLQAYVSRVRRVLHRVTAGSVRLVRQSPGYRLDGVVMDVDDFERLGDEASAFVRSGQWDEAYDAASTALALWRGPLLADLPDDSWVSRERRRADDRMERCVEALATALLGQGRPAEALEQARRLLDLQPLRDQAVWLYMLTLHRCARSAEALDVYREYAQVLDEDLGLEPVQELRELQTAILREDATLAHWPNQAPPDPGRTATRSAARARRTVPPASSGRLVGRAGVMTQIDGWLDEMCAGVPRWLLLTGPGGIGKTRLVEELVSRFDAGSAAGRTAWCSCLQDEAVPSWWPLRPIVRQLDADPEEIFPIPVEADVGATRFDIYGKIADLLRSRAREAPVLVVIDDIQWLDSASARALAHLVQTLHDVPVGVVLTLRDGPRAAEVAAILTAFARHPAATHIEVDALDGAGVVALLTELAGSPVPAPEAMVLAEQTGGNPLLLTEYARLPATERAAGVVPPAVREVLGRRFSRFDADALRILQAAAVTGDGFEPALLAATTGSSIAQVVDVLDAAANESIIVLGRDELGYQFSHELLREHLLGGLSAVRRQAIHAAIAAAFALRDGPDEDILRRAQHLSAAMPVARPATVLAACREAAEYAESVWDWEVAARQWAAARAALGARRGGRKRDLHDDLLVAQVAALARAGRGRTLLGVVDDVLQDASGMHRGRTAARLSSALLRCCGAWPWTAYGQGSSTVLDRLTAASELTRADAAAQVSLISARAVGNCYAADLRIPDELNRQALLLAEALGDADAIADALIGRALTIVGVPSCSTEVVQLLNRLADLPHRHASIDGVLRNSMLTMATFGLGNVAAVEQHLRLAVAGCDVLRLPVTRVQLRWVETSLAHWRGDLDRAEELAAQARERHERTELYGAESNFSSAHLAILWDRGALIGARSDIRSSPYPLIWSAAAAAEAGDRALGRELVKAALDPTVPPTDPVDGASLAGRRLLATHRAGDRSEYWYTVGTLCILAHAVADLRIGEAAPRILELLAPHVGYFASIGHSAPIGPVALPVGRLWALLGNTGAAEKAYAEAADAARRAGAGPSLVRIRAAQAELAPGGAERDRQLAAVAQQAAHAGLMGLAERTRRLVAAHAR